MDHQGHLDSLRRDSVALAAAASKGLEVPVPSCPGWCMADLVWHTGTAAHWATATVRWLAGVQGNPPEAPEAPPDDGLIEWFEHATLGLASALAELDPHDTLGLPLPPGYPGPSLYRHQAREVGVHRWDAEAVHGPPAPLDDDLAADWLDGLLVAWLPAAGRRGNQAQGQWAGEAVHFHRTDGEGEWMLRFHGPGEVESVRGHAAADLTVAGPGAALLLLAMNRVPATHPGIELAGDSRLLDRWAEEIRYGRPAAGPHWLGRQRPNARSGQH